MDLKGASRISVSPEPSRDFLDAAPNDANSSALPRQDRILAIDLGTRRIGLAVSDPLGITAQGLPTLERRNQEQVLAHVQSLVQDYEVSLILVGNPLNMNGTESRQSEKARAFAGELERHLNLPALLWDERLTTVEAQRVLQVSGWQKKRQPQVVDRLAAVLLLQNFLDSRRSGTPSPPGNEP